MRPDVPRPARRAARRAARGLAAILILLGSLITLSPAAAATDGATSRSDASRSGPTLEGFAVLPAETFAEGPDSGQYIGDGPINGIEVPFEDQPVQGFSAILDNEDGTFDVMSDNGYGSITNSADYNLRVYTIRPDVREARGRSGNTTGSGEIEVEGFIELSDPDGNIPFAIVNHFTDERVLTGADFDLESIQRAPDGTLWFGDEFGPFLIHTDADGRVLEAPIPLADPDGDGEIRAPQNPYNEEISTLRVMNAVRTHARMNGNTQPVIVSPWEVMLDDGDPETVVESRATPPDGLDAASSEIHTVDQLQSAGFPVVPYTINDAERMSELLALGVDGIITDRPDLLHDVIAADAPELLDEDGRIDPSFSAQGHRGARNLRPENTLPAMEVALDELMNTLETDTGVAADGVAMLDHDPAIESGKCRLADGGEYGEEDEVLVKDLTSAEIQEQFVCDGIIRDEPQANNPALSPVTAAYVADGGIADLYTIPTLPQLFDFVEFYADYHESGDGAGEPDAAVLAANAREVAYNIETKRNPRPEFVDRTVGPEEFVAAVAGAIVDAGLEEQADIQSFDWSTLLVTHEQYPEIQTVFLFGDFPKVGEAGDGTNLQTLEDGSNTPWLAGLYWPYRETVLDTPFRAQTSGGFEGMALTPDGSTLHPMLERPLTDDPAGVLRVFTFDLATGQYVPESRPYRLSTGATAIGDFILYEDGSGLVIERDGSQGQEALDGGVKRIMDVRLGGPGERIRTSVAVDLLDVADPSDLAGEGEEGDVGLEDETFAFPFVTIEDVVVLDHRTIAVLNDNNFPFSVGRHVGQSQPDDNEMAVIRLDQPLGRGGPGLPDVPRYRSRSAQTFALLGDTPYGPDQDEGFPALIEDVNGDSHVRFVLHAGDVKAGSTSCDDELLQRKRDFYDEFHDPFVLTPGDNEWTDCHREAAGQFLPTERLEAVREIFYPEPGRSIGGRPMHVATQADDPAFSDYVENQAFTSGGALFSTIHVVGSNNNLAPWDQLAGGDLPGERLAEYEDRLQAALDWLDVTFDVAAADDHVEGVFVMIHANPRLDLEEGDPERAGFEDFLAAFEERAAAFDGPVVLAHGDFHELLIDAPFTEASNVTRVQTFGAEVERWLRVTVDRRSPGVFSFQPVQVG